VAAGLLATLALWPKLGPSPEQAKHTEPPPAEQAERTDDTVAVLLRAPGAEWDETELPTRPGAPLRPGRLRLKSGLAHIEFYSGATVVLEGPAELRLISRSEAYCARGRLRATVPPQAHGFTIGSPKLRLVDRGTEFGLRVGEGEPTEVHVFQGKVELYDDAVQEAVKNELTTGRGLRLDGPGQASPIPSDPTAFKTVQQLVERSEDEMRRRQDAWRAASDALRKDPSLRHYYPFQPQDPWSRTLLDQAGGRRQPSDGAIVGCAWAPGRWPGRQGLEFKQVSDRVRLHVPGEFNGLTLAAWVRVDALPNRFNSLLMTDGWDPGAPHWHISDEGLVELGVQGRSPDKGRFHYYSPVVITPDRLGRWTHLAVTYERGGQVRHYLDGRLVSQEAAKGDFPLSLGNAEIGNWTPGSRRDFPVRYFSGGIDEFLLYSRPLNGPEIERLYLAGQPPP
jgi:hypothetical protein